LIVLVILILSFFGFTWYLKSKTHIVPNPNVKGGACNNTADKSILDNKNDTIPDLIGKCVAKCILSSNITDC
jgi:hypothetical protein